MPITVYAAIAVAVVLVALAILARAMAVRADKAKRAKRNQEFLQDRSKTYEHYQELYDAALKKLSTKWNVIEIIHDMAEYNLGPAGLPEHISYEEAFDVVRRIRAARHGELAIILHTSGGFSMPTDMIAMALKQHPGKKVAFVPYTAMSGGTVIALATTEVNMGDTAVLGPIDTQLGPWPASAYQHLRDHKDANHIRDEVLMASHLMDMLKKDEVVRAQKLIDKAHGPSVATALIADGRPHNEMITKEEVRDLGIKLSPEAFPPEIYNLVDARLKMVAKEREEIFRRGLE